MDLDKIKKLLLGNKAIIIYAVLSVALFLFFSPLCTVKINKFLADITQKLIIIEINPERESRGFDALDQNEKLTEAAQLKAEDMIERDYFSHVGPNGEQPWSWLDKVGYDYVAAGENLAMDISDPKVLKNAWLESAKHRDNIMNGYFTDVGIGIAEGEIDSKYTIVVVMFLGRELKSTTPTVVIDNQEAEEPKSEIPEVTTTKEIEKASPEEPVVVKNEKVEKQNLVLASTEGSQEISPNVPAARLFLVDDFPRILRYSLTALYFILILWLLVDMIVYERIDLFRAYRISIIIICVSLIWIPALI